MKKKALKLRLSRETVGSLERAKLGKVLGAETEPSNCIGCYPTDGVGTDCISRCMVCPQQSGPPCY